MSNDTPSVVQYVLSSLKRAAENAYPWSVTPNEAGVLVAEVERLHSALANIEHIVHDGMAVARHEGFRWGSAEERAAVVAWLRDNTCGCHDFADAIERGEHRREEEKP